MLFVLTFSIQSALWLMILHKLKMDFIISGP